MLLPTSILVATAAFLPFTGATATSDGLSGTLSRRERHENIARNAVGSINDSTALETRTSPNPKVGLAWNMDGQDDNLCQFKTSSVKYMYTWSAWCPSEASDCGISCCPMLWGAKSTGDFVKQRFKGTGKCLMGMNEVNQAGQSNMSPKQGADMWNKYIRDYKHKDGGYKLVLPSVTTEQSGIDWYTKFFKVCGGKQANCGGEVMALHYYGTSFSEFKHWITLFHDTFGMKIWVTEFACQNFSDSSRGQCSNDEIWSFMSQATQWMSQTSWIEAYFAFGMTTEMFNVNPQDQMVNPNSITPNDLGKYYIAGSH